jgi:hypothetical protein
MGKIAEAPTTSYYVKNEHVHLLGCSCMYLASKYEDIYPLDSKTISKKIAHNAFTKEQVI